MGIKMSYFQSIILGLVQGLTEFLPVSSSGHLAIFKHIFGSVFFESGITFDIMLHLGTLAAVFIVYFPDIKQLFVEFFKYIGDIFHGKIKPDTPYKKMLLMLIVGSIPAGVAGTLLKSFIETISADRLWVVGICLFITAFLLCVGDKNSRGKKDMKDLTVKNSLFVGLFQGFAILPGISRSGSTIVGGLLSGFKKEFAVKFSFLLSSPAILGAALVDFKDVIGTDATFFTGPATVGVIVAALSGFVAIKWLLNLVKSGNFKWFSVYCAVMGIITILISIF